MSESPSGTSRGAKRLRAMLWSIVLVAVAGMLLPLSAYVWTAAVHADEAAETEGRNPRSEYWRGVRESEPGYTAVRGQETNVLIQSGGETWRELRNGPVKIIGAIMVVGILLALVAYHLRTGGAKLEHRTGRKIRRWSMTDRVLHWFTAVLFIVLAITGLSLLWGSSVLIPIVGKQAFAAWASLAKPVHDYVALAFTAGLAIMLIKWFHHNLPASYDREWLRRGGGYFGAGHAPAGFANAGEKIWYWLLVVGGLALVVSGFYLLFPNFGFERGAMQTSNIVHGAIALVLTTGVIAHIYLGTLGAEGALEGMITGEVDEGWARQHHGVWLDEVERGTARPTDAVGRPVDVVTRPAVPAGPTT